MMPKGSKILGTIVQFTLDQELAGKVNGLAHANVNKPGDIVPAIIVQVGENDTVNLKIFADGPGDLYITGVTRSITPGQPRTWNFREGFEKEAAA